MASCSMGTWSPINDNLPLQQQELPEMAGPSRNGTYELSAAEKPTEGAQAIVFFEGFLWHIKNIAIKNKLSWWHGTRFFK